MKAGRFVTRSIASYIIAAGGAGSSARPAFDNGTRTMMNPSTATTTEIPQDTKGR